MNARKLVSASAAALIATGLLSAGGVARAAGSTSNADAFPVFENSITLSVQGASISGNDNTYQARTRSPANGGVGIENLYYYKDLSKETAIEVQGRALQGVEDYLGRVEMTKQDVGAFDVGYRRFRTFYDGVGGFFPLNDFWRPLAQEDLHIDRGHLWAEFSLKHPDHPQVTVRYDNSTRSGKKTSLSWGDTNLTGLALTPSNNATRKIIPGELKVQERTETLEGRIEHTIGRTEVTLRGIGTWIKNDDTRTIFRFPGEVTPSPQRITKDRQTFSTTEFGLILTTLTTLNPKVSLNTGISYQDGDTTSGGDRANALGDLPTYDFKNLYATTNRKTYTANASIGYTPTPAWVLRGTVRVEDTYTKSEGTFTRVTGTVAVPVNTPMAVNSRVKDSIVTPDLSIRYTGIPKLVLYASGSDRIDRGDRRHANAYSLLTPINPSSTLYSEDVEQDQAQYRIGANWNKSDVFTARAEVFRKNHQNKFIGYGNRLGNLYVVGYNFTGLKFTAIVKPIPELAFTTRYVPQNGYIDVTTDATAKWDSMTAKSHLFGETIDWNPNTQVFVQAGVDIGYNYISTAYPRAQTPATIAPQRNSDNNYVVENFTAGFVVTKLTDIQLQLSHQHAHNYIPTIATGTTPYGSGYSEDSATLSIKHKLAEKWIATIKVGYIDSTSEMDGGHTNFKGPLGYLAFERQL